MASVVHAPFNRRITDRVPPTSYAALLRTEGLRVSWGGIFGGVLLAVGLLILLTSLGLAVGVSAVQPGETEASTLGTGAGIWAAVSLLVALFVGGLAATRIGAISDGGTSFAEGALVWIVSILLMGYAATSGIGMLAGGAFKLLGGASQVASQAIGAATGAAGQGGESVDTSGSVDQIVQRLRDPGTSQKIASATGLPQDQVQSSLNQTAQRVEANRSNPAQAASEAKQGLSQLMSQATSSGALQQKAQQTAENVKPAATKTAWITFAALVLSLVTAVVGAMVGRRKPDVPVLR